MYRYASFVVVCADVSANLDDGVDHQLSDELKADGGGVREKVAVI